jgi:lipopolysaccharide transport system permease protein
MPLLRNHHSYAMNIVEEVNLNQVRVPVPTTIIEPSSGWVGLQLGQVWRYRELLYFLVWRDVKVRYKQTSLGVAWVVLQPLATTLILTVIFGSLAKLPSNNLPYAVFALAGLVPWNYFSASLSRGANSLIGSANLISKIYFPRLIIPIAAVLSGLLDAVVVLGLMFALMFFYGIVPSSTIVALPFFLLLAVAAALSISLWLAALNVHYRDVSYLVPFLTQFWLYATPVVYPLNLVPERWRGLYSLNPMVGVVEGFRAALFGSTETPWRFVAVSVVTVTVLLVGGLLFFRRTEKTFADVV